MEGEGTQVETDSRAGFGADVGACGRVRTGDDRHIRDPETPGVTPKAQAAFGATTAEPVVPDAQASYVRMTGYADLDGNAEITAIDVF